MILSYTNTCLIKQGKRSVVERNGVEVRYPYRNSDGTKCAVGQLITDDNYHQSIEGKSVGLLSHRLIRSIESIFGFKLSFEDFDFNFLPLLYKMQEAHDFSNSLDETLDKFKQIAIEYRIGIKK